MSASKLPFFALLFTLLVFTGCGSSSQTAERVPVSGTLTLNGKPVGAAKLVFVSMDGEKRVKATALVAHGKFAIVAKNGPIAGKNQVQVYSTGVELEQLTEGGKNINANKVLEVEIPEKYGKNSKLEVQINPDGNEDLELELK